jgi:hypothetical protein
MGGTPLRGIRATPIAGILGLVLAITRCAIAPQNADVEQRMAAQAPGSEGAGSAKAMMRQCSRSIPQSLRGCRTYICRWHRVLYQKSGRPPRARDRTARLIYIDRHPSTK